MEKVVDVAPISQIAPLDVLASWDSELCITIITKPLEKEEKNIDTKKTSEKI